VSFNSVVQAEPFNLNSLFHVFVLLLVCILVNLIVAL